LLVDTLADPAQVLAQSEMIKTRYSKLFGV